MKYRIIETRYGFMIQAYSTKRELVDIGFFRDKYEDITRWRNCTTTLEPCNPIRFGHGVVFRDYPHTPFNTFEEAEKYLIESKTPNPHRIIKEYNF